MNDRIKEMANDQARKTNYFYWGCAIGVGYNSRVEFIRCSEKEDVTLFKDFVPHYLVRYTTDKVPGAIVKTFKH